MNVLVTGGTGFIGHNIVQQLEELGHRVCVVDCKSNYLGTVNAAELDYLQSERLKKIHSVVHQIDVQERGAHFQ